MISPTKQNVIKNLLATILAFFAYPLMQRSIGEIQPNEISDFLLILSIMIVTICFANFAFTYEKSKVTTFGGRILSHATTLLFSLLLALLLEAMVIAVGIVYPSLYSMTFTFSWLLYLGIILYDFWDLYRAYLPNVAE